MSDYDEWDLACVDIIDIEMVYESKLSTRRLERLETGVKNREDFQDVLRISESDPIAVDNFDGFYKIVNGRHRVFLARKYGIDKLYVRILNPK